MYTYIGKFEEGIKQGLGEIKYDDGIRMNGLFESNKLQPK